MNTKRSEVCLAGNLILENFSQEKFPRDLVRNTFEKQHLSTAMGSRAEVRLYFSQAHFTKEKSSCIVCFRSIFVYESLILFSYPWLAQEDYLIYVLETLELTSHSFKPWKLQFWGPFWEYTFGIELLWTSRIHWNNFLSL